MIGIRLEGRLGNQLFQYAFIITASKKLNTPFFIDEFIEQSFLEKYFNNVQGKYQTLVSALFKIKGYKNLFNFHLRRLYFSSIARIKRLNVLECTLGPSETEALLRDKIIYHGHFQSESFFKSIKGEIRNKFVLKQGLIDQFNLKYRDLYKDNYVVTVHVRRTDYLNLNHLNLGGPDLSLPLAYYKKAISVYNDKKAHFVFISDDKDYIVQNFEYVTNKTISTEVEIIDFQHLLNADVCIISNSTFSWWGAWLNNKPHKTIYAPEYFMGWRVKKEVPLNIYPAEWVQIDF